MSTNAKANGKKLSLFRVILADWSWNAVGASSSSSERANAILFIGGGAFSTHYSELQFLKERRSKEGHTGHGAGRSVSTVC